jgi:ribosomal protein S18 acetylase RimI-like enzyme
MTDVLGLCTSWADGICVVRPEHGPDVAIAVADIVSGKPVPPRVSVRQRISARDAERHARPLWPDVERVALGEWELRTDPAPVGRLLKRTNSCLAIGDAGIPVSEAADRICSFYAARGRDALAQVELGSPIESELSALGWEPVPGGDTHFLVSSLAIAVRVAHSDADVELVEDGPRAHVVRLLEGREVGAARAAVDGDWLGVHGLVVDPAHRRQGHAGALMGALLEWGAERGATTVWLHVETDNQPALALYGALGLRVHHTCRYVAAPSP